MSERQKVILDTDIGDDLDDALALYAAMKNGLDIVGVTTVFRNTPGRARIAKRMMKLYGRGYENVPVYAGRSGPVGRQDPASIPMCQYSPELDRAEYAPDGGEDEAVAFILDACRRYGRDLTIIAIGPFTNIARAVEQDPAALALAGKVVIMGGAYLKQYADWNVMCDVAAADEMFRRVKNLECIGADVTHLLTATPQFRQRLLEAGGENRAMAYLGELYRLWLEANPKAALMFHDVLTVYFAMDETICSMERARVTVVTEGPAKGLTLNTDAYGKRKMNEAYRGCELQEPVRFASGVDRERFYRQLQQDLW